MTRVMLALVAAAALLGLGAAGCARNAYTTPARYDRGLVVCLSGAGGGIAGEAQRLRSGLDAGGVDRAIEIFTWSSGRVIRDQRDVSENRAKAAELARHIEEYMVAHPGRPVHLVAISAGTGISVWALEEMASPFRVDGVILLASSLDAHYDLGPALARVRDRIYTFNSLADTVLTLGVPFAGTVDQEGEWAGGLIGFRPPAGAGEAVQALYRDKLVQSFWWPGDVILGNLGDHLGTTSPLFVRARLVPIVLGNTAAQAGPTAAKPAREPADAWIVPPAKPARAAAGKASDERFVGWSVGDAAASRPARPEDSAKPVSSAAADVDESKFFRGKDPLP